MGKHVPKSKSIQEDEMDEYDSQIDELYRPFLIHSTTYVLLTEQILSLMPSERNVLLTMNEYDLTEINPMHPNTPDSPTHVIIFCIRFVAGDTFQPIGGLLTYKHKDQSGILAECLKAYINDLWKLGLYVVGTVSPPFESFKGMLNHLIDVKDFNTYAGSLIYSVAPIKEIVHIYDIQFLLIKLQNLFKEGDIKFVELSKEHRASWNDVSLVLNLSSEFKILSNYLLDNKDISRRIHIFSQQIFEQLLEMDAQGILSDNAAGSAVLLNCIRSFLQFTELDLVDLNQMCQVDGWNSFTKILQTMTFQKSKKRTCTKTKPSAIHVISNASVRRKIDFHLEENPEIIKHLAQNIDDILLIDEPDQYLGSDCEILENCKKGNIASKSVDNKKSHGKNNKQKKSKLKNSKDVSHINEVKTSNKDQTTFPKLENNPKIKLHSKKPYDKQKIIKSTKKTTSVENQKTDFGKNINIVKENGDVQINSVEDKLSGKTGDFLENVDKNQDEIDNKINFSCDIDKNNNSDESLQSSGISINKSTILDVKKSDNKIKVNNKKIHKDILKEEDFDVVINPQKLFESFIGYNIAANELNLASFEEIFSNHLRPTTENNSDNDFVDIEENSSDMLNELPSNDENYNDFCSQTDEETENSVTKICDKVPTLVESLSNEENTEYRSEDFEHNDVTCEMLCTVFGMKKLMENLINRRVKIAKPDAFVVEHIDFLVTVIKRDKNKINPVYYYGHNYGFLNSELAFSTLQNTTGLYLVKT